MPTKTPVHEAPNSSLYHRTTTAYLSAPASSRSSLITALTEPITDLYHTSGAAACEPDLWALWTTTLHTSLTLPAADTTAHNTLVTLLKDIKYLGPFAQQTTPQSNTGGADVAILHDAKLWTDLPMFAMCLREFWDSAPPHMSPDEWANFNIFQARLTAADVHDCSLQGIWALRLCLEDRRPLTHREEGAGTKRVEDVSVADLLTGAMAWFEGCGEQIAGWCREGRSYGTGPDPSKLGELAKNGEVGAEEEGLAVGGTTGQEKMVGRVEDSGYNATRWRFWRARFKAISEVRNAQGGRDKVSKQAYEAFEVVRRWDRVMGIEE